MSPASPGCRLALQMGCRQNLTNAGFNKVDKNLGGNVFLWYLVGKTKYDIPIISLSVSTDADNEALKMKLGMERVGHNLSRGCKGWRYLWMEREMPTYICDVAATNYIGPALQHYLKGWICIDETTNTLPKGSTTFLWYCHTTDAKEAITDLKISHKSSDLVMQGYTCVDVNLNEDSAGKNVFVWFKKESGRPPVKSMLLLVNHDAIHRFQSAGINVIKTNINDGNDGYQRCLCFINQQ
ncbi:hypothetical protein NL108_000220 [Boleophthalmus pectinirostris]|uniref:uncharacterized protein LOC129412251 n=1 Tax=Boleophthalmus pectinirostris TaxID=150288 RepID=UPI00243208C0|nr:uncharacterized protein LOC129412251 [Boleophthalmus pectinirostris]KAJ0047443.1 hypothetical protein NL108_000220 [Boleophthalmus pectinirostris]